MAQVVAHSPALFPEPFVRACRGLECQGVALALYLSFVHVFVVLASILSSFLSPLALRMCGNDVLRCLMFIHLNSELREQANTNLLHYLDLFGTNMYQPLPTT